MDSAIIDECMCHSFCSHFPWHAYIGQYTWLPCMHTLCSHFTAMLNLASWEDIFVDRLISVDGSIHETGRGGGGGPCSIGNPLPTRHKDRQPPRIFSLRRALPSAPTYTPASVCIIIDWLAMHNYVVMCFTASYTFRVTIIIATCI